MSQNFEVNILSKILLCAELEAIRTRMQNAINDFKEKAPHRTDYIEHTESAIETLAETELFICQLYRMLEEANGKTHLEKVVNYTLAAENERIKKELALSEKKYNGLIEFDTKK